MIGGANIHIFVFTDLKNNRFHAKEVNNAEHEYMNIAPPPPPPIIDLPTPLVQGDIYVVNQKSKRWKEI